jgi:uncharacterized protein (TIGR03437 family)
MSFRHHLAAFALAAAGCSSAWCQNYTIATYAGNGTSGYAGDGSPLGTAQFADPQAIAFDSSGNVYIADTGNNRVRKVSGGTINTVAGNGTSGYSGDNAAAINAELSRPSSIALDSSGNLYIADTANNVIRKVTTSGTISTYAGNNTNGYSGDGGQANVAALNQPTSIAIDSSGNLYIADSANNYIRKVVLSTGVITTVAGSGNTAGTLNHPIAVAVDPAGSVYIADNGNQRVLKLSGTRLTTLAGTGTAGFGGDNGASTTAQLNNPSGLSVDSAGNVYICDHNNNRIRKINTAGIITTIAGTGKQGYTGDGGPAITATLNFPQSTAINSSGNVYVADSNNDAIRILQPQAPVISSGGVGNAASGAPQISPGALASVYGTNFATANLSGSVVNNAFGVNLGGISVSVNGNAAPVMFVSPGQVNFQVPWGTTGSSATIVVSVNGGASNSVTVPLKTAGPGIFAYGAGQAIADNADFTLNSPGNPAAAGSTIVVYLTGSGPVSNQPATGAVTPLAPLSNVVSPASATLGSNTAQIPFIGLAPSFFGVVQANITIPAGLAPGNYPLTITINGETSNSATISVK